MTVQHPETIDELRQDISEILEEPEAAEFSPDEDLLDLGMDSMRMMTLVTRWNRRGIEVGFVELVEEPTLEAWLALLTRDSDGPGGDGPGDDIRIGGDREGGHTA